ncbi:hypothetical protein OYC64_008224 [Pagothenia borchgrevinki]|uniref:Uncharacterized protein n=1 Tax=Pagothenia borchgrevinki TaxID=8213 RepID=A0ABD2GV92_PAGBO
MPDFCAAYGCSNHRSLENKNPWNHLSRVSQNRREEEAVGSCPKKAGHCSAVITSVVRTLTGRGRLSGLKMVLCQQYSTSQLIFKGQKQQEAQPLQEERKMNLSLML